MAQLYFCWVFQKIYKIPLLPPISPVLEDLMIWWISHFPWNFEKSTIFFTFVYAFVYSIVFPGENFGWVCRSFGRVLGSYVYKKTPDQPSMQPLCYAQKPLLFIWGWGWVYDSMSFVHMLSCACTHIHFCSKYWNPPEFKPDKAEPFFPWPRSWHSCHAALLCKRLRRASVSMVHASSLLRRALAPPSQRVCCWSSGALKPICTCTTHDTGKHGRARAGTCIPHQTDGSATTWTTMGTSSMRLGKPWALKSSMQKDSAISSASAWLARPWTFHDGVVTASSLDVSMARWCIPTNKTKPRPCSHNHPLCGLQPLGH